MLHVGMSFPAPTKPSVGSPLAQEMYFANAETMFEAGYLSPKPLGSAASGDGEFAIPDRPPNPSSEQVETSSEEDVETLAEDKKGDDREPHVSPGELDTARKEGDEAGSYELQREDALEDRDGNPIMLDPTDRRALEFRERLRTW